MPRCARAWRIAAVAMVAACRPSSPAEYVPVVGPTPRVNPSTAEYAFGVPPLHNAIRLLAVYQPMLDVVNGRVSGFALRLEAARDFPTYEAKIVRRSLAFAIVNPYQALYAEEHGYRIFAKMGGDERLRGILLVRRDANVERIADLRGGAIAFPAPTALAATMMNKVFLKRRGLDVDREAQVRYVGSHDSVVMNVFQGLTRAGGTWPPIWDALCRDRPEVAAALEVKWETDPLVDVAVVARRDVPDEHVRAAASALVHLHESERGRSILERIRVPRFEPADAGTYEPVRAFAREYERLIGRSPSMEPSDAARDR